MQPHLVIVTDKMQSGYEYVCTAPAGRQFDPNFRPELTPKEMLRLGVFCGKYRNDCRPEFPSTWFASAKLSASGRNCALNYFGVDAARAGSILTTRADGFSGTAGTTWGGECLRKMLAKLGDGRNGPSRCAAEETLRAQQSIGAASPTRCAYFMYSEICCLTCSGCLESATVNFRRRWRAS